MDVVHLTEKTFDLYVTDFDNQGVFSTIKHARPNLRSLIVPRKHDNVVATITKFFIKTNALTLLLI